MDETNTKHVSGRGEEPFETARIAIEGMTCDKCVETIERAFRGEEGVKEVRVDRGSSTATVIFDPRKTDMPALHDLLLQHGYHPRRRADDEVPVEGPA